jgi:hypothetical protein
MKGWRPSAWHKLETGSGSFAGEILAGRRIDRPVFYPWSAGTGDGKKSPSQSNLKS